MDLQLKGKTALVTGASQGIGRAIAKGLAAEGVRICIAARRRELLDQLAQEIVAAGGAQPHIATVDIIAEGAPQKLAQEALKGLGRIAILINCAGGSRPLPIDAPDEKWHEAMTLNFTRVRQLSHAVFPDMIKHGWGRIINITGKSEPEGLNAAFSAKAGIHAWSKGLSREIGKHGITINCIPPGRIMSEQIRRNYPEEYRKEHAAKEIPVGRYGEPEELAHLAVFLASPLAAYITGTVMPVDGGLKRYAF
jgi:3-oxoacyl-[acyl-carrier protein] reductase